MLNFSDGGFTSILEVGQGPAGPPGPPGSGGGGGASAPVQVNQLTPASLWTINHNLGYRPQVQVFSVGGLRIEADIQHISVNQYQITFVQPVAGFTIYQ